MDRDLLEELARAFHDERGTGSPPVDPFLCCRAAEMKIIRTRRHLKHGGGAFIPPDTILIDSRATVERQGASALHELSHAVMRAAGEEDDEASVGYLTAALMLPRTEFDRDLRRGWDLRALKKKHAHASFEMIARRVVDLRAAVVTVFISGMLRYRWPDRRATPIERALAEDAAAARADVTAEWGSAWWCGPPPYERVIVVADSTALNRVALHRSDAPPRQRRAARW